MAAGSRNLMRIDSNVKASNYGKLTSDGAGGSMLSLGANGSIDFAGTTNLTAASFKIG